MSTLTFDLTVTVPADAWHASRRRVLYLETLLIGVAEHTGLEEAWWSVERLAGLWGKPAPRTLPPLAPSNVVPAWVLPMLRLKREAGGDLGAAWDALPGALPAGVPMPGEDEAARMLISLGLA